MILVYTFLARRARATLFSSVRWRSRGARLPTLFVLLQIFYVHVWFCHAIDQAISSAAAFLPGRLLGTMLYGHGYTCMGLMLRPLRPDDM
jgi:hypothetical protein